MGLGYAERGLTSGGGGRQAERALVTDIVTGVDSAFDQIVEGQRQGGQWAGGQEEEGRHRVRPPGLWHCCSPRQEVGKTRHFV